MDANKYTRSYLYSIAFLFLIALHYFQSNPGGYGLSIGLNNTSWIAVSIIICVGLLQWLNSKQIRLTQTDIIMFCVSICLLIPFLWSSSPWMETAYDRYFAIFAFWMLVVSGRQLTLTQDKLNNVWLLLIGGMIIQCLWGIAQFLFHESISFAVSKRPFGSFQQVNVFASMVGTALGLSIYLLLSQSLSKFSKALCWLQIFLAGILLILVQSRTGMLGVLFVIIALYIAFYTKRKSFLGLTAVLLLGVFTAFLLINVFDGYKRANASFTQGQGRILMYELTFEGIKEKPFLGHGLGSFPSVYAEKQAEYYSKTPLKPREKAYSQAHPHNELLFWWIEGGVLPLLAIVLFSAWLSWRVWKLGQAHHKALWLCSIPILLHTQTEYPMYHSAVHWVVLSLLVLQMTPESPRLYQPNFNFLPRLLLLVFPFTLFFMLSNLHTIRLMKKSVQTGKPEYLFEIINPFGQITHLNYIKSSAFMSMNNPFLLREAEIYIRHELAVRPNETAYKILYRIEQLKPNNEQAIRETFNATKYYFPHMTIPEPTNNLDSQNGSR